MTDEGLLTVRQLAADLGLPESTIRFYRDAFLEHVPVVGTGRRRRYPAEAVAVLRLIADGYAAGASRAEIGEALRSGPAGSRAVTVHSRHPSRADDAATVELLTALLESEREQREALWQMAREIVRLTQVLEGHDRVLVELADKAGIVSESRRVTAGPAPASNPPAGAAPDPAATFPALEKLRAELEAERALVERLREAKLEVERRAADAEAALDEQRPKRASMIDRLLGRSGQ